MLSEYEQIDSLRKLLNSGHVITVVSENGEPNLADFEELKSKPELLVWINAQTGNIHLRLKPEYVIIDEQKLTESKMLRISMLTAK
ncbi:hypothetical protein P7245_22245 [Vibrio parahaemolyticus]|nr:hypothetical protein [Vibrio parahaemolyticus]